MRGPLVPVRPYYKKCIVSGLHKGGRVALESDEGVPIFVAFSDGTYDVVLESIRAVQAELFGPIEARVSVMLES
jgi:hypothetical protein